MQRHSFPSEDRLGITLPNRDRRMERLESVPASAEGQLANTRPTARSCEELLLPAFSQTGARNGSHCACARPAGGAVSARGGGAARPSLSPRPHRTAPLRRAARSPRGAPPSLFGPSSRCHASLVVSPSASWRTTTNPTSRPCRPWRTRPTGCASAPSRPRLRPARGERGWRPRIWSSPPLLSAFLRPFRRARAGGKGEIPSGSAGGLGRRRGGRGLQAWRGGPRSAGGRTPRCRSGAGTFRREMAAAGAARRGASAARGTNRPRPGLVGPRSRRVLLWLRAAAGNAELMQGWNPKNSCPRRKRFLFHFVPVSWN